MTVPNFRSRSIAAALLALALAAALPAAAQPTQDAAALPAWDDLTAAQRDALVAPVRQRWNDRPEKRAHMLSHAERWQEMDPAQRERARRGAHRWQQMEPEKREAMRALYSRMKALPEGEREALRTQWKEMSPEQRRAWVKVNPAPPERPRKR